MENNNRNTNLNTANPLLENRHKYPHLPQLPVGGVLYGMELLCRLPSLLKLPQRYTYQLGSLAAATKGDVWPADHDEIANRSKLSVHIGSPEIENQDPTRPSGNGWFIPPDNFGTGWIEKDRQIGTPFLKEPLEYGWFSPENQDRTTGYTTPEDFPSRPLQDLSVE